MKKRSQKYENIIKYKRGEEGGNGRGRGRGDDKRARMITRRLLHILLHPQFLQTLNYYILYYIV